MTLLLGNALPSFGTWDGVEPRPTTRPAIRKARRTIRNWDLSHRETRRYPRTGFRQGGPVTTGYANQQTTIRCGIQRAWTGTLD